MKTILNRKQRIKVRNAFRIILAIAKKLFSLLLLVGTCIAWILLLYYIIVLIK